MPLIPPSEGPFGDLSSRFGLQARRRVEPFRHGSTPHAEQESQWVEALDRQARLQAMPPQYVFINHLLEQGHEPEDVCARLGVDMAELRAARAWLRDDPPYGSLDVRA